MYSEYVHPSCSSSSTSIASQRRLDAIAFRDVVLGSETPNKTVEFLARPWDYQKMLRRSKSFRGVSERHGVNIQRAYLRSHVKLGEVRGVKVLAEA